VIMWVAAALLFIQPAAEADPIADLIAAQSPAAGGEPHDGCSGEFIEGGLLACNWGVPVRVRLGDETITSDDDGWVLIGIPRQAPEQMSFSVEAVNASDFVRIEEVRDIAQREYRLQRVNGVPQSTVTPDPSTLPRRQREYAQKQDAFNSTWDGQGFLDGFIIPAEGIETGVYGSARIYNDGSERGVHWGLDRANDEGTPVVAPAEGLVTLAEPDMYYEGGLILIDHGQGLVSAFLHLSGVEVEAGQRVEQGELIGAIGSTGRSTGPHLDWRVKLRNQFYVDPALLLELDLSDLRTEE